MTGTGREILVEEEQREAERNALRKVRGALDGIERQEQKVHRMRRLVYAVAGVLGLLLIVAIVILFDRAGESRGPPVVLPSTADKPAQPR